MRQTVGGYATLLVALVAALVLHGALPGLASPAFLQALWVTGFAQSFADSFPPTIWATHFAAPEPAWIAFGFVGAYLTALFISAGLHPTDAYAAMVAVWIAVAFFSAWRIALRVGAGTYLSIIAAFLWISMPVIWTHSGYSLVSVGFALLSFYFWSSLHLVDNQHGRAVGQIGSAAIYFGACFISVFMEGYTFVMFAIGSSLWLLAAWISLPNRRKYLLFFAAPVHALAFGAAYIAFTAYIGRMEFPPAPIGFFRSWGADIAFLLRPTKTFFWLWDTLNLSEERSQIEFFGDTSVWMGTFILPLALAGFAAGFLVRPRNWLTIAALLISITGLYLSLGPSFKFYSTRPPELLGGSPFMSAELTLGPTGTSWLSERAPGFRNMRAAYRWIALAAFGFWLLTALLFAFCNTARRRLAASLLGGFLILSNLPHLKDAWRVNAKHRQDFMVMDQDIVADMRQALKSDEMVTFLPYGNDFLVNYLAPEVGFRSYNTGGDKNLEYARGRWPSLLRSSPFRQRGTKIVFDGEAVERVLLLLAKKETDAVIFPYFDLLQDSWPPPPINRDVVKLLLQKLDATGFVSIDKRHWYAVVRVAPAFVTSAEEGTLEAQISNSLAAISYSIGDSPIRLTNDGMENLSRFGGWHRPEGWGTWMSADARLLLHLNPVPSGDLTLALDTRMMLGPAMPRRTLTLECNGRPCGDFVYTLDNRVQKLRVTLPAGLIGPDGRLDLRFVTTPEATPKSAGVNEDGRSLGLGLTELAITSSGQGL